MMGVQYQHYTRTIGYLHSCDISQEQDQQWSTKITIFQSDPKNIHSVNPFPLKPGQQSWASPKAAVDVDNNFVLSADQAVRGLAGVKVDPNTGNLTVAWTAPVSTIGFQTIIGPKDQRVGVVSNIDP